METLMSFVCKAYWQKDEVWKTLDICSSYWGHICGVKSIYKSMSSSWKHLQFYKYKSGLESFLVLKYSHFWEENCIFYLNIFDCVFIIAHYLCSLTPFTF